VECITGAECPNATANPCKAGVHTGVPPCTGGVCGDAKVDDCRGMGLVCKPDGCKTCMNDAECAPAESACVDRKCNLGTGLCEKAPLPQASTCLTPQGGTCNGTGTCVQYKYVFVTTKPVPASFGGTAGADGACATAAGLVPLGGTWMSWTSDLGSSPLARFTKSLVPYKLLNDQITVANDWSALIGGALNHPISLDQQKNLVTSPPDVWTGTDPGGSYSGSSCTDWNFANGFMGLAGIGMVDGLNGAWTMAKEQACFNSAHLYCFQQ
jgi:hypothetical protein